MTFKPFILVLDAFGRPGSLLLQNMQSVYVGNFEECQAVKTADFSGQYCLSKIKIASVFNPVRNLFSILYMTKRTKIKYNNKRKQNT